jgi:hypothetical protein
MATVDFTDSQGARDEALKDRLAAQQITWLAGVCRRMQERLGNSDVRGPAVDYDSRKWPELPDGCGDGRSITRGSILDIAGFPALDVFTASYIFGMGRTGYGRSRYDGILAGAPDFGAILERVREIGRCQGPVIAYSQLYGGHDYDHRERPGTSPWSRVARYGPAFFTKFLYFTVPGALILDARLARRVARLVDDEHGYLRSGRTVAWTPYRYAVYLHWMTHTAAAVSRQTAPHVISPALLELTLFDLELPELPMRSGKSADASINDGAETDDEGDAAD